MLSFFRLVTHHTFYLRALNHSKGHVQISKLIEILDILVKLCFLFLQRRQVATRWTPCGAQSTKSASRRIADGRRRGHTIQGPTAAGRRRGSATPETAAEVGPRRGPTTRPTKAGIDVKSRRRNLSEAGFERRRFRGRPPTACRSSPRRSIAT